jgi:hypothetical protein
VARQVTLHAHASPQLTSPPQDPLPSQSTLQAPVPQLTESPHDEPPRHVTLQAPVPHMRLRQVWRAVHSTVHEVALPHRTPLLHWFGSEHRTWQLQPAGQNTAWLQAPPLSAQSMTQVFWAVLHDVHCDGHAAASPGGGRVSTTPESPAITQSPSTQVRPAAQRCWPSQTKSLLRWLTEQPAASAMATVVHSASFTASLPA